jgi:uncharacterized membrane protein YwaF
MRCSAFRVAGEGGSLSSDIFMHVFCFCHHTILLVKIAEPDLQSDRIFFLTGGLYIRTRFSINIKRKALFALILRISQSF